jgi:hypothetical protein
MQVEHMTLASNRVAGITAKEYKFMGRLMAGSLPVK